MSESGNDGLTFVEVFSGRNVLLLFCLLLIIVSCFVVGYSFGLRNGILEGFSQCQSSYLSCDNILLSDALYVDQEKIKPKIWDLSNFNNSKPDFYTTYNI